MAAPRGYLRAWFLLLSRPEPDFAPCRCGICMAQVQLHLGLLSLTVTVSQKPLLVGRSIQNSSIPVLLRLAGRSQSCFAALVSCARNFLYFTRHLILTCLNSRNCIRRASQLIYLRWGALNCVSSSTNSLVIRECNISRSQVTESRTRGMQEGWGCQSPSLSDLKEVLRRLRAA